MRAHYNNPASESDGAPTLRLTALTVCSVCLRGLHGSDWLDAETVIRELRSFDLATPPRLKAALCDRCVRSLRERRARPAKPLAA
jgi:hypothetical protein